MYFKHLKYYAHLIIIVLEWFHFFVLIDKLDTNVCSFAVEFIPVYDAWDMLPDSETLMQTHHLTSFFKK